MQLIVESVDGDELMAVSHEGVAAMSWSPATTELAFISPPEHLRTYYGPLRLIDVESGRIGVISDDVVLAFFWSPDGRKIAYFTVAQAADAVMSLLPDAQASARDGGAANEGLPPEDLDDDEALAVSSLWLNLWVVDLDLESGARLVQTFEPVDVFINQFLPFFDQYAKSHRIWSPGSDALVLPMMRANATGERAARITVVSIDTNPPMVVEIGDGEMAAWSTC
jgi:TolB protein